MSAEARERRNKIEGASFAELIADDDWPVVGTVFDPDPVLVIGGPYC